MELNMSVKRRSRVAYQDSLLTILSNLLFFKKIFNIWELKCLK